jgi:prepilin-type N-terminal cleavage/methylation domain-containing protein
MKRRLNLVRCPTDDCRRARSVASPSAAGFSLIELIAVAAILLLLVTLYWGPSRSDSRQRQAKLDCQNHLQRIYMALDICATEHAGKLPVVAGARTSAEALDALVPRYMADTTVFTCPGLENPPAQGNEPFRQQRISYAYYMGRRAGDPQQALMSDEQVDAQLKSAGMYAFSSTGKPPGNNHGKFGGNFLFGDGRAEASPPRIPFSLGPTQGIVLLNPTPNAK